eukprot:1158454-Pelagomonas_calceolata.AAC.7
MIFLDPVALAGNLSPSLQAPCFRPLWFGDPRRGCERRGDSEVGAWGKLVPSTQYTSDTSLIGGDARVPSKQGPYPSNWSIAGPCWQWVWQRCAAQLRSPELVHVPTDPVLFIMRSNMRRAVELKTCPSKKPKRLPKSLVKSRQAPEKSNVCVLTQALLKRWLQGHLWPQLILAPQEYRQGTTRDVEVAVVDACI